MNSKGNLIERLQAEKVEWKELGKIGYSFFRGNGIKRDQIEESGTPCVRYGEIYTTYDIWFNKCLSHVDINNVKNPKYFEKGDILFAITGENIEEIGKCCAYVGENKFLAGSDMVVMKHNQNPKYVAYALSTYNAIAQKKKGKVKSKVVHMSVDSIKKIKIPVPSLKEQGKIVQILDNFSELAARKKQYEYYREKLLTFGEEVEWLELEEICHLKGGYTPSTKNREYWENGTIPWFRMDDIRTNGRILNDSIQHITEKGVRGGKLFPKNSIIFSTSATIGEHALITTDYTASNRFVTINVKNEYKEKLDYKFLFYYCYIIKNWALKNVKVGKFPAIDLAKLRKLKIPIPPMSEQKRIVEILDRFDALCNDISEGIPAEIEARKKQYEYYRDKLLTFKNK